MKYLILITLCWAQAASAAKRPYAWLCRSIVGNAEYEAMLDRPRQPGEPLPAGYWTDYRLLVALDALVAQRIPLSQTYLLKAHREGIDGIIAEALKQPAASARKFLGGVALKHRNLGHFARLAGVSYDSSSMPEDCAANEENLFEGIDVLLQTQSPLKAADVLLFYPTGEVAQRLEKIFHCPMNGPLLWRLAREYGYRWDAAVHIVKKAQQNEMALRALVRPPQLAKVLGEKRAERTEDEYLAGLPSSIDRSSRVVHRHLATLVTQATEPITLTALVQAVQAFTLQSPERATALVLEFLEHY